ncbi:MAG: hypothetical protein WBL20_03015 [Sphingobium sp.]
MSIYFVAPVAAGADPPGRPGCRFVLAAFVGLAIAAFLASLVLSILGD